MNTPTHTPVVLTVTTATTTTDAGRQCLRDK